jgi:hypothetical protein
VELYDYFILIKIASYYNEIIFSMVISTTSLKLLSIKLWKKRKKKKLSLRNMEKMMKMKRKKGYVESNLQIVSCYINHYP